MRAARSPLFAYASNVASTFVGAVVFPHGGWLDDVLERDDETDDDAAEVVDGDPAKEGDDDAAELVDGEAHGDAANEDDGDEPPASPTD